MKIGFFGNTNNYSFILARALRRMGHEVLFLVESSTPLNRPEHCYDDIRVPYPEWIVDLSPFRFPHFALPNRKRARAIRELRRCDAVILNGLATSLLSRIDRPGIAVLTGSDLDYWADLRQITRPFAIPLRRPSVLWRYLTPVLFRQLNRKVIPAQREGILRAVAVEYFPKGLVPLADQLLEEIGVPDHRRIFFMMADLEQIRLEPPLNNSPLRLFCATRLNWKRPFPPGYGELDDKGSDVMVRGLALFRRATGARMEIRLVRKGLHIRETIDLVRAEGLDDQVVWLDEMTQKQVRDEFRMSDIVLEQFGTSMVGMAGLDAMAMGRPVIANGRPECIQPAIGVSSPICQARTPEEVAAQIHRLLDPFERLRVGRASRAYVEKYFSPQSAAQTCLDRLSENRGSVSEQHAQHNTVLRAIGG